MSEETILKLLKDMDESQAEGLDKLSGKFLTDGVTVLAKLISWICNSSIKYSILLTDCKIAKLKPLFEMVQKQTPLPPQKKKSSHIATPCNNSKIIEKVIHDQTEFIEFSEDTTKWFKSYL